MARRTVLVVVAGGILFLGAALIFLTRQTAPTPMKILISLPGWEDMEWFTSAVACTVEIVSEERQPKFAAKGRSLEFITIYTAEETDRDSTTAEREKILPVIEGDAAILAVWGAGSSGEARNTIPVLNEVPIALVSSFATSPGLTKSSYDRPGEPLIYYPSGRRTFFRVVPDDDMQGVVATRWLNQEGYKRVFIIAQENAYSAGLTGILEANAADYNLEIVGKEVITPSALSEDDLNALAERVLAKNPQVIFYPASMDKSFAVIDALRRRNPTIPVLGGDGLIVETLPAERALLEGVYATNVSPPIDKVEGAAGLVKTYTERWGKTPGCSPKQPTTIAKPPDFVLPVYEALSVMAHALETADEPTRIGVLRTLQNLGEYEGLTGTWKFDANGDITLATINLMQIQNGEWVSVRIIR
ncbi:MAG TPA: branched-chain amino acid ABC transporter substrate-binding protein [Aggregatilineales bacterium]|nr:branched-chain amino acid ABC transporter substrate-binding protein [Anaerolineales bacterium]HRE49145.1 branched-chain amino acid ABC transporter substrate-binding protein [Aggregatilineales bacterium]